jgi:hypothetical protein
MQDVPKIVRERLRAAMAAPNHPDADVLTAFAEKSLPALERDVVLEHLARCGDCREILALALPATEKVESKPVPARGGWLTYPSLRWGFVAAGIVAVVSVGVVQLQRRAATPDMVTKAKPQLDAATSEARNEPPAAAPPAQYEKVVRDEDKRAMSKTAVADSAKSDNHETQLVARAAAVPMTPQVSGGAATGAISRQAPHGPKAPSQGQQQQKSLQYQAPSPASPAASAKQEAANQLQATPPVARTSDREISDQTVVANEFPSRGAEAHDRLEKAKEPVTTPLRIPGLQALPGQMSGYVVDPSGAVVPNARVTITASNQAGTASAVTDAGGRWEIAGLVSGNYKAQVEAQGFGRKSLDFDYDANRPSMYNFSLDIGHMSETVEVAAENAQVETSAAAGAAVASQNKPAPEPLNSRAFAALAKMAPGTQNVSSVLPSWTISPAGGLQRSFDQGHSWQDVDVYASAAYGGNLSSVEVVAKKSRAKEKDTDTKYLKKQAATFVFRAVAATGAEVWAGGTSGMLYHSLDAGNHWTRVVPSATGAILTGDIVALEFSDPQHGRVTTSVPEVWTTTDAGQTWQKQ